MKDFSPDVGYMAGHALLLAETVICSNDEMALAAYSKSVTPWCFSLPEMPGYMVQ
jgi:hypothetical protein